MLKLPTYIVAIGFKENETVVRVTFDDKSKLKAQRVQWFVHRDGFLAGIIEVISMLASTSASGINGYKMLHSPCRDILADSADIPHWSQQ